MRVLFINHTPFKSLLGEHGHEFLQHKPRTAVAVPGLPPDALFPVQTIEHGQDKFMYGGLSGSIFRPDHIDPVMKRQFFIHKISEIF